MGTKVVPLMRTLPLRPMNSSSRERNRVVRSPLRSQEQLRAPSGAVAYGTPARTVFRNYGMYYTISGDYIPE